MSQTHSPGLVDASHWTYVAAAMADSLHRSLNQGTQLSPSIPRGVYKAARNFFCIVTEAFDSDVPINPVASAANYFIAIHALQLSVNPVSGSEEEFNTILRKYSGVVDALDPELKEAPIPLAEDIEKVAIFFEQLARDGEAVRSSRNGWNRKSIFI